MKRLARWMMVAAMASGFGACDQAATESVDPALMEDLPVGDLEVAKSDAGWGHATTCKPVLDLEPLVAPRIVVSLDGLSLHLWDEQGDYDKVFPIGPGALEHGESLTPVSTYTADQLFYIRGDLAPVKDGPSPSQAKWGWNHECRMWWTSETGEKVPVFAGLPFLRFQGHWSGAYGIHGPVDNYYQEDGGTLRRGFVSHGCVRMDADGISELYARIRGSKVPVRVQKAVERRDNGLSVDVEERWIGAECLTADDCGFDGAICRDNAYSGRKTCSQPCDLYCPDRYGYPTTFCVDDVVSGSGMCVTKESAMHGGCQGDHVLPVPGVSRHGQSWKKATVCLPGTEGWMGDRCLADAECAGGICRPLDDPAAGDAGMCTQACTKYCPDMAGQAGTFCVEADASSTMGDTGMCVAKCTQNADCALGSTCESEPRVHQPWVTSQVCLPY